jgi:hypothetical protein
MLNEKTHLAEPSATFFGARPFIHDEEGLTGEWRSCPIALESSTLVYRVKTHLLQ